MARPKLSEKGLLTPDNCVITQIDLQPQMLFGVSNFDRQLVINNNVALAKAARIFGVPYVLTSVETQGFSGQTWPQILAVNPDARPIERTSMNSWDDQGYVNAIKQTGRKKIVMSGITTDVCVAFATLSALDAGYEVYVVVDASGSMSDATQQAALMRMQDAGAIIGTWFALSCELLEDWRNPAGAGSAELFIEHFPAYAEIFNSHKAHSGGR